jgi:hypothetical protein
MTTSEQLEREAETARAQITATLDELRTRMTPGQVVDQLVDYVRNGSGATFLDNFRQHVVNNPLPVTLVGAGLAWLAMATRRPSVGGGDFAGSFRAAGETATDAAEIARNTGRAAGERATASAGRWTDNASQVASDWAEQTRATASDAAEQTRSAASRFSETIGARASETGARLQDTAASASSAVTQAASAAYGAAAQGSRQGAAVLGRATGTLSNAAGTLSETATAGGRNMMDFLKDQPLVLAGVGLALGALLGASLPGTEAEDRLMGEASDATKSEAKEFAEQQADRGKAVGQEALSAASREFDQQLEQHGRGHEGRQQGSQQDAEPRTRERAEPGSQERKEAGTQAWAEGLTAAHTEVDREAPLVPSHDDGAMETETHGASGAREYPTE